MNLPTFKQLMLDTHLELEDQDVETLIAGELRQLLTKKEDIETHRLRSLLDQAYSENAFEMAQANDAS